MPRCHASIIAVFVAIASLAARAAADVEGYQNPPAQVPTTPPARPAVPAPPALPADPVVGNWRGTLTSSSGTESAIVITIVKGGDGYTGSTNGLGATSDAPLKRVTVNGARVAVEAADESKLGQVALTTDLTAEGNTLKGTGTLSVGPQRFEVTLALQRRPRQDAIQPHVEQRLDYFAGRWTFEYLGAEYPPLSAGGRTGTVAFTRVGRSNFMVGRVDGELLGKPYQENLSIGFDPETRMLAFLERRSDGVELVSLASWRSPIAISFQTSPVQSGGKTYQLRRLLSVRSATAFDVTEEFSVDGGPFRRLGSGHFTKTP